MKRLLLLSTIFFALSLNVFAEGGAAAANLPLPEGFSSVSGGGITLQWGSTARTSRFV